MTQLFNPITMETMVAGVRPRRYEGHRRRRRADQDGFVGFAVVNRLQHWLDFCSMIGRQDWADDPTLHAVVDRTERADELNPVIWAWAAERTTAEIVELAALWRVPAIEVGNGASIPAMDHFAEYGFYDANPDGGFLQPTRAVPHAPADRRRRRGARRRRRSGSSERRRQRPPVPRPADARPVRPASRSPACASPTSRRSGPVRSWPTRWRCSAPTSSTSSRPPGPTAPG